ncbi:hypothetical protein F5Y08DRAFT_347324 [Xylaria arbuscula]|nr:hypothetical protein F5Y08DRAFT_347324 [Xylaria arbuscula]
MHLSTRIRGYCLVAYLGPTARPAGCTQEIRQCPFSKAPKSRQLYTQPPMARARVLVLENPSVLSAVCFLQDIRTRLFRPGSFQGVAPIIQ